MNISDSAHSFLICAYQQCPADCDSFSLSLTKDYTVDGVFFAEGVAVPSFVSLIRDAAILGDLLLILNNNIRVYSDKANPVVNSRTSVLNLIVVDIPGGGACSFLKVE